ncbi:hypothetical protein E4U32_000589 [Claviceps aff. humidiphila group G2b]|nr:hypothetical protein E4U32_000589 [Claviceps aff. humidiphila group G2b]
MAKESRNMGVIGSEGVEMVNQICHSGVAYQARILEGDLWGTRRTPSGVVKAAFDERKTRGVPELYWRAPDVVSPICFADNQCESGLFERLLRVTVKPRKAFDEVRGIVSDRGTFAVFRIYPQPVFDGEALVDEESLVLIAPD